MSRCVQTFDWHYVCTFFMYVCVYCLCVYMCVYEYMCVCVCVCVCLSASVCVAFSSCSPPTASLVFLKL
jgi:hypothetical protein